jgi:hypothetical protein
MQALVDVAFRDLHRRQAACILAGERIGNSTEQ